MAGTFDNKGVVALHFDVPEHSLPLNEFITSAQAIKNIISDFDGELFEGKLRPEFYVLPPHKGGLIEALGIVLASGVTVSGIMWAFINSDVGKAYIKGLTGKEPTQFAKELGEEHRDLFSSDSGSTGQKYSYKNKLIAVLLTYILAQMVMGFIEKEPLVLDEIGVTKKKHRVAYQAKNSLIQSCINNPNVNGLGFSESHIFPISRQDFEKHIVDFPPDDDEDIKWIADACDVKVNSPNWKREGKRQWQGDTDKFQELNFSIEDEAFWKHVEIKDIQPDINDNIRVQWVHPNAGEKKPANIRVLKVLSFNGRDISTALSDEQIGKIIGEFSHQPPDEQITLFDALGSREDERGG
jgi:hypothetical protein